MCGLPRTFGRTRCAEQLRRFGSTRQQAQKTQRPIIQLTRDKIYEGEGRELLWEQYALHVELYKFYLAIVINVNACYYAATGAILTYYFQHAKDGMARIGLLFPIAFSIAIGGIFLYGSSLVGVVRQEMFDIRDKLGLSTAPEFLVLTVFLVVMGFLMVATGLVLAVYFGRAA